MSAAAPKTPATAAAAPWDGCAVASVICLALPLLGPIASIVLGSIGVRRIQRAASPVRGRRLAWAGVGLGWLFLILQCAGLMMVGDWATNLIRRQGHEAIVATIEGKPDTAKLWVRPGPQGATPEEFEALHRALHDRFGDLSDVNITAMKNKGVASATFTIAFTANFAKGSAFGSVDMVQGPSFGFDLRMLAKSMTIDMDETRLTLPREEGKP